MKHGNKKHHELCQSKAANAAAATINELTRAVASIGKEGKQVAYREVLRQLGVELL